MKIALDIIAVALLVLSAVIGIRKGFIKTVIGLVGMLTVFLLAYELSVPLGGVIDRKIVNPAVRKGVSSKVAEAIGVELGEGDAEEQLKNFESEVAEYVKGEGGLSIVKAGKEEIKKAAEKAKGNVVATIFSAADKVSSGVSRTISVLLLIAAGILLLFLLRLIIRPLLKAFHLRKCDATLGGILGAARGILFVLLFAFAVRLAMPMFGQTLTREDVDKTIMFKYAYSVVDGE